MGRGGGGVALPVDVGTSAGVFSVTDFRAAGDGVTDDSAAINAAISAASPGGVVFFPGGTFLLSSYLTLDSGVTLRGLGRGVSVIKASSSLGATAMLRSSLSGGTTDVAIEDLEFDGNKANRTSDHPSGHGVVLYGTTGSPCARVTVRDCFFHDFPGISVAFQNTQGVTATGNEVKNGGRDGISCFYACTDVDISHNWIHGCLDDHIGVHNDTAGEGYPTRVSITGNRIGPSRTKESWESYNGSGIKVLGALYATIADNDIAEGFTAGITLGSSPVSDLKHVRVRGGVISDAGTHNSTTGAGQGIEITAGQEDSNTYGIVDLEVSDVTIVNAKSHGVSVESLTSDNYIDDLALSRLKIYCGTGYANTGRGIHVGTAFNLRNPRFLNNYVRDAQGRGLSVGDGTNAVTNPHVIGNEVYDSGTGSPTYGIAVLKPTSGKIVGNISKNQKGSTQTYGLRFESATGTVDLYRNDFTGNATGKTTEASNGSATVYRMEHEEFFEGIEIADPAAPSANTGRLYFKDDGGGKTRLAARFPTGAVQTIATEP